MSWKQEIHRFCGMLGFISGLLPLMYGQQTEIDSFELEDVVITAQYQPQSVENAVQPVRLIGRKKMEQMAAVSLGDVLSNELNIRLSRDVILGQSLSLQGLSGENVKIMIDGVPVIGRQGGNIDLSQINLLDIERIEIVEGPLSVNYGTNALAGTINLITNGGATNGWQTRVDAYTEQTGTINLGARVKWADQKNRLQLSVGRNFFDGWNPGDPSWPDFEQPIADTTRFKQWKPRVQAFGRAQYHREIGDVQVGIRSDYFEELLINRGFPRAPYAETAFDDTYRTRRIDQALTAQGKIGSHWSMNIVAAYNDFTRWSHTYFKDLTTLDQTLVESPGEQDTSVFRLGMSRGSFTRSFDNEGLTTEFGYEANYEVGVGQRIENQQQHQGDYAAFATAEWQLTDWIVFRPGLRYAYNTAYKAPLVPSLNVKVQAQDVQLRFSYGRGFRAPSLKELYFYFVDINHNIVGNPDLKAEHAHNFSFNTRWQTILDETQLLKLEGGAFYNDLQNLITLAQVDAPEFTYVNIGEFKSKGLNARAQWSTNTTKIQLGTSYIGRYNRLSASESVAVFSYYPEVTGNMSFTHPTIHTSLSVFYKYQGRLPGFFLDGEGNIQEQFVEDYHLLDATLSQPIFNNQFQISIGAKNLLNVTSVQALAAAGAHSGGNSNIPVALGRFYFLKLQLTISSP